MILAMSSTRGPSQLSSTSHASSALTGSRVPRPGPGWTAEGDRGSVADLQPGVLWTPTAVTSPGAMAAVTARPPSPSCRHRPAGSSAERGRASRRPRPYRDVGRLALGQKSCLSRPTSHSARAPTTDSHRPRHRSAPHPQSCRCGTGSGVSSEMRIVRRQPSGRVIAGCHAGQGRFDKAWETRYWCPWTGAPGAWRHSPW